MNFWDRLILVFYCELAGTPAGRDAVVRLLDLSVAQNHLLPVNLGRRSLLILLVVCVPGSALRAAAEAELVRREPLPTPQRLRELLANLRPGGFDELLEIGRGDTPLSRGMFAGVLFHPNDHEVIYRLSRFLGRVQLDDPDNFRTEARRRIGAALQVYYGRPWGGDDFLVVVYRMVMVEVFRGDRGVLPPVFPTPNPAVWFAVLDAGERLFLARCSHRNRLDVLLLYFHFYARLTPIQIAAILEEWDTNWTPDDVLHQLEWAWSQVLTR